MNKPAPAALWTPPATTEPKQPGYDAWLDAELAQGLADLDAGRSMTLEDLRKEFGHE